ncbi:hypothetical protein Hamer_G022809 [Homarus americanus]|uniref:Uncharacterized protein n=1 Tax=Homarus americanus TaxID=6706 RepID=A0A8J5JQP1_HOMAM|nr:hypothetical protein Hamer_G022809 [Homarus americanus]
MSRAPPSLCRWSQFWAVWVPGAGFLARAMPSLKEKKLKEAKIQNAVAKARVTTPETHNEPKKKEESK